MTLQTKKRGNIDYLYDYSKESGKIKSTYLGKVGDPKTDAKVKAWGEEQEKKKAEKLKAKKKIKTIEPLDNAADAIEKEVGSVPLPKPETTPAHAPAQLPHKTWKEVGPTLHKKPEEHKTGLLI
jgi:hypothetical protein